MNDYQKMKSDLESIKKKSKLLLHACCAPCSSEVLNFLKDYFNITIYFHNPNIEPKEEYDKRFNEFIKLCKHYDFKIINALYDNEEYENYVNITPFIKEGSYHCYLCYQYRLENTAIYAKENNYDYFTTTLSISPYKKSLWINKIGTELSMKYKINFLYSDFKKENGYYKSIILSKKYNLYRQNYCGCLYSKEIEKK